MTSGRHILKTFFVARKSSGVSFSNFYNFKEPQGQDTNVQYVVRFYV